MGHVLKADQIHFEEPFQLSIDPARQTRGNGSHQAGAPSRIRIAGRGPGFVMIEVTCSCGKVTQVHCEYVTDNAAAAVAEPANR